MVTRALTEESHQQEGHAHRRGFRTHQKGTHHKSKASSYLYSKKTTLGVQKGTCRGSPIADPAHHWESQFSVSSHLAALSLPSNSSALLPLIPRLWPSSTGAPAVAFQVRLESHSITLKSRLTVMSYEMALLSSVSATYMLLCHIDAPVDEALRPHAVVT
ncbi:unnamed protein product [Arctogadus glacialis]